MHRRAAKSGRRCLDDLKAIVAHACAAEANFALAEMERLNAEALAALTTQHDVKLATFPGDLVSAARSEAVDVLGELAARDAIDRQGARLLQRFPRAHRAVVARLDRSGARVARRLIVIRNLTRPRRLTTSAASSAARSLSRGRAGVFMVNLVLTLFRSCRAVDRIAARGHACPARIAQTVKGPVP